MSDSNSSNTPWNVFGWKSSKSQVVFFVQCVAAFLLIITALVNLSVPNLVVGSEERNYWKLALASTIGYLFPNPTLASRNKQ